MAYQGKPGEGVFQWNRGGWFGAQIGATAWLVLLGLLLLPQSPMLGALILSLGLAPNALGVVLWRRRHELAPYPALQILLGACGVAALVSLLAVRSFGPGEPSFDMPSVASLLIYPLLMGVFHFRERSARADAA